MISIFMKMILPTLGLCQFLDNLFFNILSSTPSQILTYYSHITNDYYPFINSIPTSYSRATCCLVTHPSILIPNNPLTQVRLCILYTAQKSLAKGTNGP